MISTPAPSTEVSATPHSCGAPNVSLQGCAFYPVDADHGWAGELQSSPQQPLLLTVSCIVLARQDLSSVDLLLPRLRTQLEDSGYPFELITVVDAAPGLAPELARAHFDRAGHRLIAVDAALCNDEAAKLGIGLARGDAIVFVDARTRQTLRMVSWMIARWALGDRLQYVGPIADSSVQDSRLGECGDMLLLDRDLARWLSNIAP